MLVAHIVSAVLFIGPFTMAASRFPRAASMATSAQDEPLRSYRRTSESYAVTSLAVPAIGVILASESGFWSARWLQLSIGLWAIGAFVVFAAVLPMQRRVIDALDSGRPIADDVQRLHMVTGAASVIWVGVVALMVIKPW